MGHETRMVVPFPDIDLMSNDPSERAARSFILERPKARCGLPLDSMVSTGKGFCGIQGNPYPYKEHRKNAQEAIQLAHEKMESGHFDILILDEINNAVSLNLVDLEQVLDIIRRKPAQMHLVLTGRDAHQQVIELADTVSEIEEIKHAYRKGIEPQAGIDY